MSKSSDKVKAWRVRTKKRIVEAMGGRCACCGYDRCTSALALHHRDPSQKDFGFGDFRASAISWAKAVMELRKCIMVCHNCHAEVHEGLREIPAEAAQFDERWADYKVLEQSLREASWMKCPGCKKPVPPHRKHCSWACSSRATAEAKKLTDMS